MYVHIVGSRQDPVHKFVDRPVSADDAESVEAAQVVVPRHLPRVPGMGGLPHDLWSRAERRDEERRREEEEEKEE